MQVTVEMKKAMTTTLRNWNLVISSAIDSKWND